MARSRVRGVHTEVGGAGATRHRAEKSSGDHQAESHQAESHQAGRSSGEIERRDRAEKRRTPPRGGGPEAAFGVSRVITPDVGAFGRAGRTSPTRGPYGPRGPSPRWMAGEGARDVRWVSSGRGASAERTA